MARLGKYDVIIVRAGSASCVLANRLIADSDRKMLLLTSASSEIPVAARAPDARIRLIPAEYDRKCHAIPQAACFRRRIAWPRGRMPGGSGPANTPGLMSDGEQCGPATAFRELVRSARLPLNQHPPHWDRQSRGGGSIDLVSARLRRLRVS